MQQAGRRCINLNWCKKMKAQLNNRIFPELPENLIIAVGECDGLEIECECEVGKHVAIVENNVIVAVSVIDGWVDKSWEYQTKFKIKMNSDRFVAMVSDVNAIVPDVSMNVSNLGITEIYLDVIDEQFRTLVNYYGGEIYDSREN